MIIRKYGIELRRVTRDDIETIRKGRNKKNIRLKMYDQRVITKKQQELWFESINNINNFYFVICHQSKDIGLIYGKNIDWELKENEGGIFIWRDDFLGTGVPALASIILLQLCFSIVELDRIFALVHPQNTSAQQYNLDQGYIFLDKEKRKMMLTRENYNMRIGRLRRLAGKGHDTTPLSLMDIEIPSTASLQTLPDVFLDKWRKHI